MKPNDYVVRQSTTSVNNTTLSVERNRSSINRTSIAEEELI
jgi:hypothetical protein